LEALWLLLTQSAIIAMRIVRLPMKTVMEYVTIMRREFAQQTD